MKAKLHPRKGERGIALVLVLAILSLVLITVVTFLTTATLERGNAKAYASAYQAQLAAESGLEAAKFALTQLDATGVPITQRDTFVVVRNEVAGTGSAPASNVNYYVGVPEARANNGP